VFDVGLGNLPRSKLAHVSSRKGLYTVRRHGALEGPDRHLCPCKLLGTEQLLKVVKASLDCGTRHVVVQEREQRAAYS
jgi:hypothetical protein